MKSRALLGLAVIFVFAAASAEAVPFTIQVGDNDGYGLGIPDNGNASWASFIPQDFRSPGEQAATDGSQFTDFYGAFHSGQNILPLVGNVIFNLPGTVTAATLTIDMADFQWPLGTEILARINGIPQPGFFQFGDGFQVTRVRNFAIGAAELAAANLAGQLILTIDGNGTNDYVAFDYFELSGQAVPEPATLLLLGIGLLALGARRNRRQQ